MNTEKPPHPLWGIVLLGMILAWLSLSMWMQATSFDSTEGRAIAMIAAPLLAGWGWWFYRWTQSGK